MSYAYGTREWEDSFTQLMKDLLDVEREPYILGTPSWIATYEALIQGDAEYRKLAQGWEGGVIIHITAEPAVGLDEDMYLLIDLWHGDCRGVRLVPTESGENGDYVLTASYERWKQVMTGVFIGSIVLLSCLSTSGWGGLESRMMISVAGSSSSSCRAHPLMIPPISWLRSLPPTPMAWDIPSPL